MDKIKVYLKKVLKSTEYNGLSVFGRGQSFDWKFLLSVFLLILIVAVSYSVHVFLGVKAGDIFQGDYVIPKHNDSINRAVLDKVVKSFDLRAQQLTQLQKNKPVFVDPSL